MQCFNYLTIWRYDMQWLIDFYTANAVLINSVLAGIGLAIVDKVVEKSNFKPNSTANLILAPVFTAIIKFLEALKIKKK